nr:MAG TPA: type I neck protein [Caudoviricetes sp.]
MGKYKFELNRAGVRSLLRSDEMQAMLKGKASGAAQRCGDGYAAGSYVLTTRAAARVSAVTSAAKQDNLKNNTILKALK